MHRRIVFIAAVIAAVVFFDQITKALISNYLEMNEAVEVIGGFFNLVYFKNPGAAFGIFKDYGILGTVFLSAVSVTAVIIIGFLFKRSGSVFTDMALSLVAGGAMGNLIDRVRYGSVVDFMDFHVIGYHWPAFNAADAAITAGVILMLIRMVFKGD